MTIIERLTEAQRVLEEHTQYDDQEGSGEDLARLTCIDAKETISELLSALERLSEATKRANDIQHSGGEIQPKDWSELYDLTNEARAAIAKATTNS